MTTGRPALLAHTDGRVRCAWCGTDPLYRDYHDDEWGVPVHDDGRLFEMLCLEGAQAGLSWYTVLRRREGYRAAFDGFDARRIAAYDHARMAALMADPRIVRNRLKVQAFVANARACLELQAAGSFSAWLWHFAPAGARGRRPLGPGDVPVSTRESDSMSKALQARGFRFVGSTICYAFMQAVGMVDDHLSGCWRAH